MMKALTKKRNDKGFTLVELIVVIAILAVLMAILVPQYIQYVERSRQGTDASMMGEILHAAEIQNALMEKPLGTGSKVVITTEATTGAVKIAVTVAGDTDNKEATSFATKLSTVIANNGTAATAGAYTTKATVTSNACKTAAVTLTITFDANGSPSWDGSADTGAVPANSKDFIKSLSTGDATAKTT